MSICLQPDTVPGYTCVTTVTQHNTADHAQTHRCCDRKFRVSVQELHENRSGLSAPTERWVAELAKDEELDERRLAERGGEATLLAHCLELRHG